MHAVMLAPHWVGEVPGRHVPFVALEQQPLGHVVVVSQAN
jgi:hypothetical protein